MLWWRLLVGCIECSWMRSMRWNNSHSPPQKNLSTTRLKKKRVQCILSVVNQMVTLNSSGLCAPSGDVYTRCFLGLSSPILFFFFFFLLFSVLFPTMTRHFLFVLFIVRVLLFLFLFWLPPLKTHGHNSIAVFVS